MRNCCVLHIPPEEALVFQTKERAPILLCIEVFRPDEMETIIQEREGKMAIDQMRRKKRASGTSSSITEGMADNPYLMMDSDGVNV